MYIIDAGFSAGKGVNYDLTAADIGQTLGGLGRTAVDTRNQMLSHSPTIDNWAAWNVPTVTKEVNGNQVTYKATFDNSGSVQNEPVNWIPLAIIGGAVLAVIAILK